MEARASLKRDLHELLIKDDISLESGIVNRLFFDMANVKLEDDNSYRHYGLRLTSSSYEKDQSVQCSFPSGISIAEIFQILDVLGIESEKYKTDEALKLTNDDEKAFYAKFVDKYESIKKNDPNMIRQYRVKSRPILESSAVSTLNEYTNAAVKTILKDAEPDASASISAIVDAMLLLQSKTQNLHDQPIFYKSIIATSPEIAKLLPAQEVVQNKDLARQLGLVLQGIVQFTQYHRNESVIANKKFMTEMEKTLNEKFRISAKECDVLEEAMLRLAGVDMGPNKKTKLRIGGDKARAVLELTDITEANADKFVKYFQDMGDETAIEGSGYRRHGSSIPQFAAASMSLESVSYGGRPEPKEYIEEHSIEIDGKFLHDTMFNVILQTVASSAPEKMAEYQAKSKACLDKKAEEAAKLQGNKSTLFQAAPAQDSDDESMDFLMQPSM